MPKTQVVKRNPDYHNLKAKRQTNGKKSPKQAAQVAYDYTFFNHFHPYVGRLIEELNKRSVGGLLKPELHEDLGAHGAFFDATYAPRTDRVSVRSFFKEIDTSVEGPYSIYNWELLFHAPFAVAVNLSKNQKFADAQRWFHYIFDPTTDDTTKPPHVRFWKFIAFRNDKPIYQIDELLRIMAKPEDECDADELAAKSDIQAGFERSRTNPFQPHVIARTRPLAYQLAVVMKYIDNLVAWGDSLFRQDTIESVNEATQLYVLAANLLGPRPQEIPARNSVKPKTFALLRGSGLDDFGNALVELEGQFPFNMSYPAVNGVNTSQTAPLFGMGHTLYFCIPKNDKLLGYWDTVADRLYKIRHCMSIEGVVRQMPLFDPPIDPGMLVKAAAGGIDVGSLVAGMNQPLSPVRSSLLMQKASEICSEVRSLGASLLSALEKQDNEALSRLRQQHETNILQLAQDVRYLQWKEAEEATEGLIRNRDTALERYGFYQRLMGDGGTKKAALDGMRIQRRDLTEENFDELYGELVGQYGQKVPTQDYNRLVVIDDSFFAAVPGFPVGMYLTPPEFVAMNVIPPISAAVRVGATAADIIFSILSLIPNIDAKLAYWGLGVATEITGGQFLSNLGSAVSRSLNTVASIADQIGSTMSQAASYQRRGDDWTLQGNLAARELSQVGRQIIASMIREQITRHEYESQKRQIENAQETETFLREKFTNEELYGWMQGELSKLYYEYYKLAFDVARRAEQTVKHELMRPEMDALSFVRFNYWDGGRKGLLCGETLHLDLKRLELAYHDNNKREYELTQHVSLRQLAPEALLALKATGRCEFLVPEWLYDMGTPGHYLRRIKSVSVSMPSVTGPYTNLNCTLTLTRSTVRTSPQLLDGEYARAAEDARFVDYYGVQSVVTSSGTNDAGMFDVNLRDERFLHFEGAGAADSAWAIELPTECRQFDYKTIADVVLHIRYTARQGGTQLKQRADARVRELLHTANAAGLVRGFSLKHEFASEWHAFANGAGNLKIKIKKEFLPYFAQDGDIAIGGVDLYAIVDRKLETRTVAIVAADLTDAMNNDDEIELDIAPDSKVLLRDEDQLVFVVLKYSL